MTINANIKGRFLGGQGEDTITSKTPTAEAPNIAGSDYPFIIAPNSLIESQTSAARPPTDPAATDDSIDFGHNLRNLTGSHDWVGADLNGGNADILNGAKIVEITDPSGVPMLAFDRKGGTPSTLNNYMAAAALRGYSDFPGPYQTNTPETVAVSGPASFTKLMKANILLWVCCRVPGESGEVILDWSPYQSVGFDLGGFRRTSSLIAGQSTTGSVGAFLGDGATYDNGIGANSDNTAGAFNGEYAAFNKGVAPGIQVRMFAINPGGNNYGFMVDGNGVMNREIAPVAGASGTEWLGNTGPKGLMLNLGDNAPDGFGVYSMGVKNYGGVISEYEIFNAARFMGKTGLLPPWW